MNNVKFILILAGLVGLIGCGGVDLDMENILPSTGESQKLSNAAEFVAASQKGKQTVNRFKVDTSTGATFGTLVGKTPGGYKVFSTVQGQMASENAQAAAAAAAYQ